MTGTIAEDENSLPFLTPGEWCLEGVIKAEPGDFRVEEIPAYLPSGQGEHLFLLVQKTGVSAEALLGHLARSLQVPREEIGVAGLKDRQAVTRQWISVPARCEARLPEVATGAIEVLEACRHGNKLKTGHLRGNRFEILIRSTQSDQLKMARKLAECVQRQGVPNYFGDQRFGQSGSTLELGNALLRGEKSPGSIPWKRRRFLVRLACSATQSWLFNQVLANRLRAGRLQTALVGDVMQVCESGGLFVCDDPEQDQPRLDQRQICLTGPLFGPQMKSPSGAVLEAEQQVLEAAGLSAEMFARMRRQTPGTRRALVLWPQDLTVAADPAGLRLTFTLPAGAYATVVLAEFLKRPEMSPPQTSKEEARATDSAATAAQGDKEQPADAPT